MLRKVFLSILSVTLIGCSTFAPDYVDPAEPDTMTTAGGCTGIACPNSSGTSALTH